MRSIFQTGDTKLHVFKVKEADFARFDAESVHQVCSTFALAREIEWSTRLFVKDMLEEGEEGIGTFLSVQHKSPALAGQSVEIIATFEGVVEGEILCSYKAMVGDRVVAEGRTGQKILPKSKINSLFERLK